MLEAPHKDFIISLLLFSLLWNKLNNNKGYAFLILYSHNRIQYGQIAELTSQYKVRNLQYNAEVHKSLIYNDCIYIQRWGKQSHQPTLHVPVFKQ